MKDTGIFSFARTQSQRFPNKMLRPAFSVALRKNFFLDEKRRPLNFKLSLKTINTKMVSPVYEFAHALYFFDKDYFFKHGRYWDWQEVRFIEIKEKAELIDIY